MAVIVCVITALFVAGTFLTQPKANVVESRESSLCTYDTNATHQLDPPDCTSHADQYLIAAVAADVDEELLFYSDRLHGEMFRVDIGATGTEATLLLYGLGSVEGIAVDWLAKNIFWTDSDWNHISVARYDGTNRRILVKDDVGKPRGIAINPFEGLMFWTELGGDNADSSGRMERANMDGTGRVTIIDTGLVSPSGLAIDFTNNRIFFADQGTSRIESVTIDGQDRQVFYKQDESIFVDIAINGAVLYTTSRNASETGGAVLVLQLADDDGGDGSGGDVGGADGSWAGEVLQTVKHDGRGFGITTFNDSSQPYEIRGGTGACGYDNGGCEQLCLPIRPTLRSCACSTGYSLASDRVTCDTYYVKEYFLLVVDSSLKKIFQVTGSLDDNDSPIPDVAALPIIDLEFPVSVAYDHLDGTVYWTDLSRQAIGRATLNGSNVNADFISNVHGSGGIALDWRRRFLYWTDEVKNEVSVVSITGRQDDVAPRVFLRDLDKPSAIAVNSLNGDVYWTDAGDVPKIERASVHGNNRRVIAEGQLALVNCLTVDAQGGVMYWCDAQYGRIETSDLDGVGRRTLVTFTGEAQPYSLAIYGEYLYWTDWLKHGLTRANRWSGAEPAEIGDGQFLRMQGLASYEFIPVDPEETSTLVTVTNGGFSSSATVDPQKPTSDALNVALIGTAIGGGLLIIGLIIGLLICCAHHRRKSRDPNNSVPTAIRSTSFVAAYYEPNGYSGTERAQFKSSDPPSSQERTPPPLPEPREQTEPLYEYIDESTAGELVLHAHLNPAYVGTENGNETPRYRLQISPGKGSAGVLVSARTADEDDAYLAPMTTQGTKH